ncbi:2-hydroxyacyl-CoA dehydratase family protein [Sphingobium sp. WCS2017Hpa-17]|uniref:2-hydroxyacyl-CoA dehydratase family protein n=1 Tax=Sphingobium sp. WCS2017Hpa-17 TaxID=3073638 RepID=UPI00288BE169|nr:2-hydroxyacyl-CoA dehydratase family protein [Sphingobium sp. WCS2017Hpa-17]
MTAARALETAAAAYRDPTGVAIRLRSEGHRVLRVIGSDAPLPLLRAAGFSPVRMAPSPGHPTPRADALLGASTGRRRAHHLVEQLLDPAMTDPVLFTRADAEQAQIFSALRENARLGVAGPRIVTLLDLLHIDRPSSRAYNGQRLAQLRVWLAEAGGHHFTDADLTNAADAADEVNALLRTADALRFGPAPRLSGTAMLHLIGGAAILPPAEMVPLLKALIENAASLPRLTGTPAFVAGSAQETDLHAAEIEAEGLRIVGESHEWGIMRFARPTPRSIADWSDPTLAVPNAAARRAILTALASDGARDRHATIILHLSVDMDEAAPWNAAALHDQPIPVQMVRCPLDSADPLRQALRGEQTAPPARTQPAAQQPKTRSRKLLTASTSSGDYQRDWFASVRAQAVAGAPFAMVNANAPQEILRALDVPFVVNQWWASIVAAKQQSSRYRDLLKARHYPTDVEAYSAQGLAAALDEDGEQAPWGGLPRPDFVHAIASSDATPGIFEAWALESGATPMLYERTVDPRWQIDTNWWEILPDRWDEVLEPERLDLLVAELRDVIATIEARTGGRFDENRFIEVMHLVNEQEEYYRKTRDLIANTTPAPIGIVDSMPATMVPQWHRGTIWGRDAAKALYEEVAVRVAQKQAAIPNEQVRLMWVGRGLWSNTGFYQKWEESYGAIFVWSMYLALAADGYIRNFDRDRDPLRALAARFLTMGDELRMPSWAAPWHVHEAQTHGIDGAVALTDADPFVLRALIAAGIPVLELGVDNYALDRANADDLERRIADFITGPCMQMAARRKAPA